jgi:uncharacterized protein (DUF934 family)
MPTLIDRSGLAVDPWISVDGPGADVAATPAAQPPGSDLLVPLASWRAHRAHWLAHDGRLGLLLGPADDPAAIADDLAQIGLVAIEFPTFTDGRGYSTARLIRGRYGYGGELRAVGDVQRDQLFLLARCGFDSFALRDGQDVSEALSAFSDFSHTYQAAADGGARFERR